MYKGCTRDVQGMYKGCTRDTQGNNTIATPSQHHRNTGAIPWQYLASSPCPRHPKAGGPRKGRWRNAECSMPGTGMLWRRGGGGRYSGSLITPIIYLEIVRNVIASPCAAGNPELEICAGRASPDCGNCWSGAGCGLVVAGNCRRRNNLV